MAVTEEQRREVYEQDCARLGHILSYDKTLRFESGQAAQVAGPEGLQPHIECRRCRKVWLVIEQPEPDYETATAALDARLLPEHRGRRGAATPAGIDVGAAAKGT